ncbi:MAG: hypothetical protein A3F73_04655 [Gallionellales bacterium RIFCSPLOWO2_12_FULL_59_22]|nr:MAG: hypothetical protein A2Z65_03930 [Gallionellales bacterium RIFCSPLOWO2_02_58_13]OGT14303.1 MAG: hypothetical protein A3F73_04655 [Gallionellales bacterium RIFCSPLOWO2_12_FULL_59_22]
MRKHKSKNLEPGQVAKIKYRRLGQTDLNVSEIALGCAGFWGDRLFSERKAISVVSEALSHGVNFFDTGHNYSNFNAEPRLGKALRNLLGSGDRSKVILSSKAGTVVAAGKLALSKPAKIKDFSPGYIESSCAQSLRNLGTDYLDIFQLHGITKEEITEGLLDRLDTMKRNGMFRFLGVNTHALADMNFIAEHPDRFDMVLLDYNVLQLDREPVIAKLQANGIGVVAGTVLGQGHLIKGKIGRIRSMSDIWYLARSLVRPGGRELAAKSAAMQEVLMSVEGMTAAQAAVSFVLQNSSVASCIIGTTKIANLIEVIGAANNDLSQHDIERIRATYQSMQH